LKINTLLHWQQTFFNGEDNASTEFDTFSSVSIGLIISLAISYDQIQIKLII